MVRVPTLCAPASTPAKPAMVQRAMFASGSDRVRFRPTAPCEAWKRRAQASSRLAPSLSFMSRAQIRRIARILAISSKKSRWLTMMVKNSGPRSSAGGPRARHGADLIRDRVERVEAGQLLLAEDDGVGVQAQRGIDREDVGVAGEELLEDVVLDEAG